MEDIQREARRWALANALDHEGKASSGAVAGKLVAKSSELKSRIKELMQTIEGAVREVNRLSSEQQRAELERLGPPEELTREGRRGLPELPDVDRYPKIVTRFAPNPNGPLHLGHVRTALLSYEYARRYSGKFILRFEDTNPANALAEMYELIREDLRWLGIEWDEELEQSGRLEVYYTHAEQLLRRGKAYVCTCEVEEFRRLRDRGESCPCRGLSPEEQLERWRGMTGGKFGEGEAVVRIKTDLRHPNPAVRDWPALRIIVAPHPRVGECYRVWPLYNFSVSVDDHEFGVTHIIRGKEHEVNEVRQRQLFEHLGWSYPTAVQHGRLSVSGAVLSKTRAMEGIRAGEYEGYDDPRLGTVAAFRRRGFLPEAVRKVILDVGLTPVDSTISLKNLYTENRRLIDPSANRYFFVPEPVKLAVRGVPELEEAKLRLHPSQLERGERVLPLERDDDLLYVRVSPDDVAKTREGDVLRLKDLLNFKLSSREPLEAEFAGFELRDVPKIQWISAGAIEVEVLRPDGSREGGLAEPEVANLKVGEVIQFERYGFARIDAIKPKLSAVYAHR
ncbi:MAG: glutamate--tRNA ligase [Candidatus Hadarchaeota archaeon]|nr:glutamate--tRNA ligase [Candidatus Hadarchaeota archaeon]